MEARVMIMAGGTGGHVFPALALAGELRQRGAEVFWLGTPDSFESRVVPEHGFELELISIQGLRGKGLVRWLSAPFKLLRAMLQAAQVIRHRKPQLVVGMGGFASGPGGLVARLMGLPLVIHEQNAIPGLTNRWLAKVATRVLQAFPGSLEGATTTGNPVRQDILGLEKNLEHDADSVGTVNFLVLGGSLGAQALNETVPRALAELDIASKFLVRHQSGRDKTEATLARYRDMAVEAEVTPFVDDMAQAYAWADLVICRAGALTIAELAASGTPSILVPFPFAVDDHQTANARYLSQAGAAELMPQSELTPASLAERLSDLLSNPEQLKTMAAKARSLAIPDATQRVADVCEEVLSR